MKVLHIIPNLNSGGGAQAILYRLILNDSENNHEVVALSALGDMGAELAQRGIPVSSLDLNGFVRLPAVLYSLFRYIRKSRPDAIQSWMYHADFLGGVCGAVAGHKNIVWGLHHTTFDPSGSSRSSRFCARACGLLSGVIPKAIISCSRAGISAHERLGYKPGKMSVVHNGYDSDYFLPGKASHELLKLAAGPDLHKSVFGMVARWDPQKDHDNLLQALVHLRERNQTDWSCVLCGSNMDANNAELVNLLHRYELTDQVLLLGRRNDVDVLLASLDFTVLSSRFGEAFPNVLNESMLSGTPVVTTDVGDSSWIAGDCGWVVPPGDAVQLGDAIFEALELCEDVAAWDELSRRSRRRVIEQFNIERMVSGYIEVWSR